MCARFLRGDTEMHFNRVVVAVVGDGTELSLSVFILSGRLILFPPPTKNKKPQQNPPLFTFLKCRRGWGGSISLPIFSYFILLQKVDYYYFYSQSQFTSDCQKTPDKVFCNIHIPDRSQGHLYAFRDNKYSPFLTLVKQ